METFIYMVNNKSSMSKKGLFVVIDGIDYAGKTNALKRVEINNGLDTPDIQKYDGIPKEMGDKTKYNRDNTDPRSRFSFYLGTNKQFSKRIEAETEINNSIVVRYSLSTTAYHNMMIQESEGTNPHLEEIVKKENFLIPNITFVVTLSKDDLEKRMMKRPPQHKHESDANKLMTVQNEFKRLSEQKYKSTFGKVVIIESEKNKADTVHKINEYISQYIAEQY